MQFAGPPIVSEGAVWTIARDGKLYAIDPSNGAVRFGIDVERPPTSRRRA